MEGFVQKFQISIRPLESNVIEEFGCAEGRYSNFTKEVCFARCIGMNEEREYLRSLYEMEMYLAGKRDGKHAGYERVFALDTRLYPDQVAEYIELYENRKREGSRFPFQFQNMSWETAFREAYETVLMLYQESTGHFEASVVRNFGVKLLFWIGVYFPRLFLETMKMRTFPKFVYCGKIKAQEYLFLYLLVLIGCDVLYLNTEEDAAVGSEKLLALSSLFTAGEKRQYKIPVKWEQGITALWNRREEEPRISAAAGHGPVDIRRPVRPVSASGVQEKRPLQPGNKAPASGSASSKAPVSDEAGIQISGSVFRRPDRDKKTKHAAPPLTVRLPQVLLPHREETEGCREPLPYEELAKIASSVVMIGVYNKKKEQFKTGSGVLISDKGYLLTNFHVACEAAYYGIKLEEEEHIYYTDELVKYNQYHDLAVLKMDSTRPPVPIYRGSRELVRGQKVVAIGSPLGLFNTVSDGIISGFRKMEDVSMIQFTAPISHGSSGGALLDLYGNLIGILTAGYDDGQNLNLAVDYKTLQMFANGFI